MAMPTKTHAGVYNTGLGASVPLRATLAMGAVGAIVGGSAAAAQNIARVKHKEVTREQAVKNSLKEAGTTGLATAVATAAVGAVGLTGALSLVGMVAVAIGAKYVVDRALSARPRATRAVQEDPVLGGEVAVAAKPDQKTPDKTPDVKK